MVRTTVGTVAEAELSVQEAESVITIDATQTDTVPAGEKETTGVKAPSGTVLEVLTIKVFISAPPNATTDIHLLRLNGPNGSNRYLQAGSDNSTNISIDDGIIKDANAGQAPTTEISQTTQIRSIRLDDTNGIEFQYDNRTDGDQTENRRIEILALQRGVS
jgi:hypothetical protein